MITFKPTIKQFDALELLSDNITTEVLYGGAAGSGKSMIGCCWLIINCLNYPGTRWLMGRSRLSVLKGSTLKTFNDIVKDWNISDRIKINHQSNTIYFDNGSEIVLKDLFTYPSDPDFDGLGSTEYTGAFVDEISQISYKAFEMVNTRLRYKLKEYNLIPKLFATCNPSKSWLYTTFYKPWMDENLPDYRKFIPALPTDNPYIDPNYIIQLRKSSQAIQERLLYGNWNYNDDIDSLFKYADLVKMRDTSSVIGGQMYLTCDIARLGKDTTLLIVWDGLTMIEIVQLEGVTTDISANKIRGLSGQYNIPMQNIIIDADGIGGGVVDQLRGVVSFINNSRQIEVNGQPNIYQNLKSQCYYQLAEYVEMGKIKAITIKDEAFEILCQELQCIKQKDMDRDGKLSVIPKDVMKKILGRSPDFADAMMMRMYWELKNTPTRTFSVGMSRKW